MENKIYEDLKNNSILGYSTSKYIDFIINLTEKEKIDFLDAVLINYGFPDELIVPEKIYFLSTLTNCDRLEVLNIIKNYIEDADKE